MLENTQILMNEEIRNPMMGPFQQGDSGMIQERALLPENEGNRHILIQTAQDSNQGYTERPILNENNLVRLVKNTGEYDKTQLVHMGLGAGVDMPNGICEQGGLENVPAVYTNLQNAPKKRKLSQEMPLVKSEPGEW